MTHDHVDAAVSRALYGAAGELQSAIADIGAQRVTEADARRAVRVALQSQLGRRVKPEHRVPPVSDWTRGAGAFDVAVTEGENPIAAVEIKWCRAADKLAEALWDVLKLVPYTLGTMELSAYLIYAAPQSTWKQAGKRPVELFESREHEVADLLSRYEADWRWLLGGVKRPRPVKLRARFGTTLMGSLPILSGDGEHWELRCSKVLALPVQILHFDERGGR